jgi:hypothetical protein
MWKSGEDLRKKAKDKAAGTTTVINRAALARRKKRLAERKRKDRDGRG